MLVIGLDVGTTGTKALVVDELGNVKSSAYREYELRGDGDRVTQNADDWWDAVKYTVKSAVEAAHGEISAISLSTQGASMLATDSDGNPLCDVMTWMDARAVKEVEFLDDAVGTERIYEKCGWPLSPAGDAAKILWLKNNMPEVFESAAMFPSTIEFINKKLTGRFVADPTNAAIRQLFNIKEGRYDREILEAVGIGEEKLPEVAPVSSFVGTLTPDAAKALGLTADVKVFCGAHDQYCASLGAGACDAGDMLLATGTAWVILGITNELLYTDNHICPGIHPASGRYGAMASLVSAGSALKWYKNLIDGDFKTMDREASSRRESAKDVFVLPYVAGAGFPHNLPDAGAAIYGARIGTDKYDIALAVMEGVAFEARSVLEKFAERGMKIDRLMMTGGAARSDLWASIVGAVTGCEIIRPAESETCCIGAAECALVGIGVYRNFDECRKVVVKSDSLGKCDPEAVDFYNKKYSVYTKVRQNIYGV